MDKTYIIGSKVPSHPLRGIKGMDLGNSTKHRNLAATGVYDGQSKPRNSGYP